MQTTTEEAVPRVKTSEIQALSRSVANSCEEAKAPVPTRLGWLMQAADDCDKLLEMLKSEVFAEAAIALERNRKLGRQVNLQEKSEVAI